MMTNEPIRVEFDAVLEEFVDVQMRQLRRSPNWRKSRLLWAISSGVVGGVLAIIGLDNLIGRRVGAEVLIAGALGGLVGRMWGALSDRAVAMQAREALQQEYGARLPMRCEIELRPTCLWVRQDGVIWEHDWKTAEAVEDTPDGVELWFAWGLVVARNRGFAPPADRARFVEQARALHMAARMQSDAHR